MLAGRHSIGAGGVGVASPEFVGSRTFTTTSASTFTVPLTSLTGGLASAPRTGDVVVAFLLAGSSASISIPAGWSLLVTVNSAGFYATDLFVIYKTMGATPDTGITIVDGLPFSTRSLSAAVMVYAGASSAAPVFATHSGDNVQVDPPSITPTMPGSIIIAGGGTCHGRGTQTLSSTEFDGFISAGANSTSDTTVGMGRFAWVTGAFNPAAFTFSGASDADAKRTAVSLVLIPA